MKKMIEDNGDFICFVLCLGTLLAIALIIAGIVNEFETASNIKTLTLKADMFKSCVVNNNPAECSIAVEAIK